MTGSGRPGTPDPEVSFLRYMARYDLQVGTIIFDGKIHRFPSPMDKKKSKKSAWYVAFPEDHTRPYAGAFGDWKRGIDETWSMRRNGDEDDFDPEALKRV